MPSSCIVNNLYQVLISLRSPATDLVLLNSGPSLIEVVKRYFIAGILARIFKATRAVEQGS